MGQSGREQSGLVYRWSRSIRPVTPITSGGRRRRLVPLRPYCSLSSCNLTATSNRGRGIRGPQRASRKRCRLRRGTGRQATAVAALASLGSQRLECWSGAWRLPCAQRPGASGSSRRLAEFLPLPSKPSLTATAGGRWLCYSVGVSSSLWQEWEADCEAPLSVPVPNAKRLRCAPLSNASGGGEWPPETVGVRGREGC